MFRTLYTMPLLILTILFSIPSLASSPFGIDPHDALKGTPWESLSCKLDYDHPLNPAVNQTLTIEKWDLNDLYMNGAKYVEFAGFEVTLKLSVPLIPPSHLPPSVDLSKIQPAMYVEIKDTESGMRVYTTMGFLNDLQAHVAEAHITATREATSHQASWFSINCKMQLP